MQAWFEKVGKMFEMAFISGDRWKLYLDGLGVTLQIAFLQRSWVWSSVRW